MSSERNSGGIYFYTVVLAVLFLWAPLHEGGTTHLGWTVSRLLPATAVLVALWRSFGRGALELPRSSLLICWVALAIMLIVGAIRAKYSYTAGQWFMGYTAMAAVFFIAAHVARTGKRIWIENALILSGVVESCWGVGQYLWGEGVRSHGSFFNASFFGGYLAAVSALPLARLVFSTKKDFLNSFRTFVYILIWLLLVAGVLVSGSRGGIAALLVGVTAVGWSRIGVKVVPLILALIFLILVIPNPFQKRLLKLSKTDIYAWSRAGMWRSSIEMIADYPLGVGLGMYRFYSQQYAFPVPKAYARYGKVAQKAHSAYMDLACELSPATALLVICMSGYLLILGLGAARRGKSFEFAAWSGALTAVFVHAAADSVQKSPPIAFVGAASAGIIWALNLGPSTVRLKAFRRLRWALPALGALVVWTVIAPAAAYWADSHAREVHEEKWLRLATVFAPNNADYWYDRATREKALWRQGADIKHLENALDYLTHAWDLNPQGVKYPSALASLLSSVGNSGKKGGEVLHDAVDAYEHAERLAPKNPFYTHRKGKLLIQLDLRKKAIEAFRRAVEIEPNFLDARRQLARALMNEGKVEKGVEQYRILLEKFARRPKKLVSDYERELAEIDEKAVGREAAEAESRLHPTGFSDD